MRALAIYIYIFTSKNWKLLILSRDETSPSKGKILHILEFSFKNCLKLSKIENLKNKISPPHLYAALICSIKFEQWLRIHLWEIFQNFTFFSSILSKSKMKFCKIRMAIPFITVITVYNFFDSVNSIVTWNLFNEISYFLGRTQPIASYTTSYQKRYIGSFIVLVWDMWTKIDFVMWLNTNLQ